MAADAGAPPPGAEEEVQVTCRFITKLPVEFRVPTTPVAVPANLTRYGLSQIINHLLALDPARPFDFLIGGEILRQSLHKHLQARSISAEATLEVEYVPAVLPPKPREDLPHDDWIGSLAALGDGSLVASGCYDGVVRLWRGGERIAEFAAHEGAVKAAAALPGGAAARPLLLSAGADALARVWRLPAESDGGGGVQAVATLVGHSAGVEAAAASPSGALCATGGWDKEVALWRAGGALEAAWEAAGAGGPGADDGAAAAAAKRRRVGLGAAAGAAAPLEEAPRARLAGHTQCVSALAWSDPGSLVSGSWDHSVRVWDVEVGAASSVLHHNKVVYCLAVPVATGALGPVALGGAERTVRVWDARAARGDAVALRPLGSHAGWVAAAAWHPASAHHLATASHDGTAKLWDLRTSVPLATLAPGAAAGAAAADPARLLAAAWAGAGALAVGGADRALHTFDVELHL